MRKMKSCENQKELEPNMCLDSANKASAWRTGEF